MTLALFEELKLRCAYICAVASSDLPSQLKHDLIFRGDVTNPINYLISLGDIYGWEDQAWESFEEEVQEYAVVIARLLADLEKVDDQD